VTTICTLMDELSPKNHAHSDLITYVTDRPGHDMRYAIDAGKIERELDWRPTVTVEGGMRLTVEWYLNNGWWWQAIRERGFSDDRLGLKT
ncbi:MAG: GDP-mannose 4,6-dehydratase, partial [Pseudomonadota bacterium]